MLNIPQGLF